MQDGKIDEFEDRLIDLVKEHPIIWDLNNVGEKDGRPKHLQKEDVWNEIAKKLDRNVVLCKRKWNCMRDSFRKSLKRTNSDPELHKWHRFDQLVFLTSVYQNQDSR